MSDPHQYDDASAPARSAGHADDAAPPVTDPYAPDQPTARQAREPQTSGEDVRSADSAAEPTNDQSPGARRDRGAYSPEPVRSASSAGSASPFGSAGSQPSAPAQPPASLPVNPLPANQPQVSDHSGGAVAAPTRGIHVPVAEHSEPTSKIFSNLNLNGPVPARVRPAIGEWGPKQVPSSKQKKRARIMVNVWFAVAILAVVALGYFFFMALTGRPLFG